MRRFLTSFIPALLLAAPLLAEEGGPMPPPPGQRPPEGQAGGQNGGPKPEFMKEIREVEMQMRALREKADQDPEVIKLRQAADDATKALRTKEEEIMAKDPSFAALKAKRDELRAKFAPPRPPGEGRDGKDGKKDAPKEHHDK